MRNNLLLRDPKEFVKEVLSRILSEMEISRGLEAVQELRRCGKTTQAVLRAVEEFRRGKKVLIVTLNQNLRDYTLTTAQTYLAPTPFYVSHHSIGLGDARLHVITSGETIRGLDLDLVILDEVNLDLPLPSNVEVLDSKTLLREILSHKE